MHTGKEKKDQNATEDSFNKNIVPILSIPKLCSYCTISNSVVMFSKVVNKIVARPETINTLNKVCPIMVVLEKHLVKTTLNYVISWSSGRSKLKAKIPGWY